MQSELRQVSIEITVMRNSVLANAIFLSDQTCLHAAQKLG